MTPNDRMQRVERLDQAIRDQRTFLHRIPDPDTRERAEANLFSLIQMRDAMVSCLGHLLDGPSAQREA